MMKRIALFLGLALLAASPALGADNAVTLTPGSGVTMRTIDVGGGLQSPLWIPGDVNGNPAWGIAGTPNANVLSIQGVVGGIAVPISAVSLPLMTGAATSANQTTGNSSLATIATNSSLPIPDCAATPCTNKIGNTYSMSDYPVGATPLTASATGTTAATTATLAGTAGKTTWICGFSIRANATAAATGNATVTGTISGTLNFTQWTAPTTTAISPVEMHSPKCVPASGQNQAIAVVSAPPGTGGVVSVAAWGYQL